MSTGVAIVGIGMHPFGRHPSLTGLEQGAAAARAALADAGIDWEDIQFAFGGSNAAGKADTLVNELGLTGIQFVNVNNGCATGGSALAMGFAAIRSGANDLGMVVGFDKHPPGAFNPNPADYGIGEWYGETGMMLTTQFFGMKIQRYAAEHAISEDTLAAVAEKAFALGALNENAWRRTPLSRDAIRSSAMVAHPLTKYMFCSPAEGGVALVLCRSDQAHRYSSRPVHLRSAAMRTRRFGSFEVFSPWLPAVDGSSPTTDAAAAAFEQAGVGPDEVDLAQVQDTESGAEVMHMAETGLCDHGDQQDLIQSGATQIDGSLPINTDGGCLANGEPIGASGLRQVYESVLQLQGRAGQRQVPGDPTVAFTHVYGAPGVSACTVLTR